MLIAAYLLVTGLQAAAANNALPVEYSEATIKPLPVDLPGCWRFSPEFVACGGCEDVNNCAPCQGQACNALTWQVCLRTREITPTTGSGHQAIVDGPFPCYAVYDCGACQACLTTYGGGVGGDGSEYRIIIGDPCIGSGS
jgi:hypothetical protein